MINNVNVFCPFFLKCDKDNDQFYYNVLGLIIGII